MVYKNGLPPSVPLGIELVGEVEVVPSPSSTTSVSVQYVVSILCCVPELLTSIVAVRPSYCLIGTRVTHRHVWRGCL